MAYELPKADRDYESKRAPWKDDPIIRRSRELLVPDTLEWSGKRPYEDPYRNKPVEMEAPCGWTLRLPIFETAKGRVVSTNTCTGLGTPTMAMAWHAWNYLEVVEGVAPTFLRPGFSISRVDFARDVQISDSVDRLSELIAEAVQRSFEWEAYRKSRQLGVTILGAANGDRLRIYHKSLELMKKLTCSILPGPFEDVIRVELQLRKGQLDERQRKSVHAMRSVRVKPEPREDDIPVIGRKFRPGQKRIRRPHLWGMKRNWMPQRAIRATQDVDKFLIENGWEWLLPDAPGVTIPDPEYGAIRVG